MPARDKTLAAAMCLAKDLNLCALIHRLTGRRIVEAEQKGRRRAGYGEQLMERLSGDLTPRFGRGFGVNNLENMRRFFLAYPSAGISQTVSRKLSLAELSQAFTLPWSAYVRLLSVADIHARSFYAQEAVRGGWSVRQLDRQIGSQFYERTALSKDKAVMLGQALARYALEGLPNQVMAANYRTVLPDAELLQEELVHTRRLLEERGARKSQGLQPVAAPGPDPAETVHAEGHGRQARPGASPASR